MEQRNTVISRGYVQLCKHRATNTVQVSDQTRWGCMIRRHACHGESTLERVNHTDWPLTPPQCSTADLASHSHAITPSKRRGSKTTHKIHAHAHKHERCSRILIYGNYKLQLTAETASGRQTARQQSLEVVCCSGSQHDMIRQLPDWGTLRLWYKQRGIVSVHVMFASRLQCRPVGRKGPHRLYIAEASDAQMACKCTWHTSVW